MSLLDLAALLASLQDTSPWLGALALCLAIGALVASLAVARRTSRERRRLDRMRRDLEAFTEASVRVADSLDHVLRGSVEPAEITTSSRRYLLMQARERMQRGEPVDTLATNLQLCEDEKYLLAFIGEGARERRLGVA